MTLKARNLPPVDKDVKVPSAVKSAAAAAEELHKKLYGGAEPDNGNPTDPNSGDNPAPNPTTGQTAQSEAATPPATTVTAEGNVSQDAIDPALSGAALAAQGQQTVQPAQVNQPPKTDEASWEHKYISMKGRFDKATKQIEELTDTIRSLQNVIATLQAAPPTQPVQPANPLVTEADREEYGEEFLDLVGRQARQVVVPELEKINQRLESVTSVFQQTAREKLFSTLDQAVPNWREINRNEDFLAWLKLPDPYSGAIRHKLLTEAFEQNSAPRVLAFFKGFLAEEAATDPAKALGQPPAQAQPAKVPLETLAAPGRAKSPAAPAPVVGKPIITRAQITEFYADVAAGKYRGREQEKARIEAEIFAATRDGRIQ